MCCENQSTLLQGIIIGASGGLAVWCVGILRDQTLKCIDKNKVLSYLKNNTKNERKWRSTRTIASFTDLPLDRVRYICSVHKNIAQNTRNNGNENAEDLWALKSLVRQNEEL